METRQTHIKSSFIPDPGQMFTLLFKVKECQITSVHERYWALYKGDLSGWHLNMDTSFPLRFMIRVQVNLILVSDVFLKKIHDQNLPLKHCCTLGFMLEKQWKHHQVILFLQCTEFLHFLLKWLNVKYLKAKDLKPGMFVTVRGVKTHWLNNKGSEAVINSLTLICWCPLDEKWGLNSAPFLSNWWSSVSFAPARWHRDIYQVSQWF